MSATPRRSARVASRAASRNPTPVSQAASGRGSASRRSSPKSQELPPLPSKTSTTYGGATQHDLPEDQPVGQAVDSLASMLESRREEVEMASDSRALSPVKRVQTQDSTRPVASGTARAASSAPSQAGAARKGSKKNPPSRLRKSTGSHLPDLAEHDEEEPTSASGTQPKDVSRTHGLGKSGTSGQPSFTAGKHVGANASSTTPQRRSASAQASAHTFNHIPATEDPTLAEIPASGYGKTLTVIVLFLMTLFLTGKTLITESAMSVAGDAIGELAYYPKAALFTAGNKVRSLCATEVVHVPWDEAREHEGQAQEQIKQMNLWHSMEHVNFFSASLGAVVNPFLTSPSIDWYRVNSDIKYNGPGILQRARPPIAALEPWFEAGDCWCAAATPHKDHPASPQPKLQLGIEMATELYPTTFLLDQIPKAGTLDPNSAPKQLELWFEIKDERLRELTWRQFFELNPGHGIDINPDEEPNISQSQAIRTIRGGDLPETYVLVGQFERFGKRYMEHFQVQVNNGSPTEKDNWFAQNKFTVRNAVVRVTENYGQAYTCIYRVRIEGLTHSMLQGGSEEDDVEKSLSG